jgi:hypothetical protein
MKELLVDCFRTFARFHIKPYLTEAPVHFSGGIAYVFADILRNVLSEEQIIAGSIVKSPLKGLIQFHKKHTEHIQ